MNLLEIDNIEVYAVFTRVVDCIQGPSPGRERRSGIAAEDQGNRTRCFPMRGNNKYPLGFFEL